MSIPRTHGRGRYFSHPLNKIESKETDLPALMARLRAGEREAKDEAIKFFIRKALAIAHGYSVYGNSETFHDFASVAIEGLIVAINRVAAKERPETDNINGYLSDCIHGHLSDYIAENHSVRIPARTQRHRKDLKVSFLPFDEQEMFSKIENDIEIKEIIEKLPQSEREREILDLRLQGYVDSKIAEMVGLSHTSVFLIRRELQQRFLEKYNEQ